MKRLPIVFGALLAIAGLVFVVRVANMPDYRKYEPKYLHPELPPLEYPITRAKSDPALNATPRTLSMTAVDNVPEAPEPGYTRQWIEWTDYGYDSTYCYKPQYKPTVCVHMLLRDERTGVRVLDVPSDWETMVLVCVTSNRSRYAHGEIWSFYNPGTPMQYEYSEMRMIGAVCVLPIFDPASSTIEIQRTHPYNPPYRDWK